MAESTGRRAASRWCVALCAGAVVLLVAAVVLVVIAIDDRDDARERLDHARVAVRTQRDQVARAEEALARARAILAGFTVPVPEALAATQNVASLVDQQLAAEQVVQRAAVAGDPGPYNRAVERADAIVDQLNAALVQLRGQIQSLQLQVVPAA